VQPSPESFKFLYGNAGLAQRRARCSPINFFVVRDYNLGKRQVASEDDVASMLAYGKKSCLKKG